MHPPQMTTQHICSNVQIHFYEGLDGINGFVQHPYFTDKNVEKKKKKGIMGQEIGMYDDDPGWQLCEYDGLLIRKNQ